MQKIKYLLLVAMLVVCGSASAQFSNTTKTTSASPAVGGQQKGVDGWNTFFIEYAPTKFNYDGDEDDDDELSMNTLSFGWRKAFGVSQKVPLFVETGLGISYSFNNEEDEDSDDDLSIKWKTNLLSLNIPVYLGYNFNLANGKIDLAPYLGVDLRVNLMGKQKIEFGGEYASEAEEYWEDMDMPTEWNLFDKDDMGGDNYTWKRFQAGWRIGANATFSKKFTVGISYGSDFTEISKKTKTSSFRVTAGIRF